MLECLIIGGGHCGLLCGNLLNQAGLSYIIADSSVHIGDVWRHRPKNLRLFTSRQFCGLADLPMPGDPEGYATGHEFADHMASFAASKKLNVQLETRVVNLIKVDDHFIATTQTGQTFHARTVINATGSNQMPVVPAFANQLWPEVRQIRCSEYYDEVAIPTHSRIVVCGDGASGRQIAAELALKHKVTLACGRVRKLVPNRIGGHDIFWWLDKATLLYAGSGSLIARILKKRDPIPVASANNASLAQLGVTIKPRALGTDGKNIIFADGTSEPVDVVIWCVGYQEDMSWFRLPGVSSVKDLVSHKGQTPEPGFFVVGRKWLSCRASELILGADRDTRRVVNFVRHYLTSADTMAYEGYQSS